MWQRFWLAALACLCCVPMAYGEIVIPKDATIGLVLSGGGARGLAHVGVIRVLEANGIKPHIITGTSMGSIVGALYATGRSAQDIDRIARNMNWRDALSDASPRQNQPYPFRQLDAAMTADFRMSVTRDGITFPRGMIEGQHLEQILGDLFEQNGVALNIENLPIRFAAVAADLETGQQVVLDQGDLPSAIRASMSIPGALSPVEREGKLLVDGGIANNMPIDVARAMGADFIIAVDVTAPLRKRDELHNIFEVAGQTSAFLVRLNTLAQRKNLRTDEVLVLPDLTGYGSAAFDQEEAIIEAGVEAALQVLDLDSVELTLVDDVMPEPEEVAPMIDFVKVSNNSVINDEVVRNLIRQRIGERLDRKQLEADLSSLYGLDYFSVVRYRVVEEGERTGLEVVCLKRETGNNWLKMGLELSDSFKGNSDFGLLASLRSAGLNSYGGTAFAMVELGTSPSLEFHFLQPLDNRLKYFIEPAVGYSAEVIDLYDESFQEEPFSRYQRRNTWVQLSLGRSLWRELGEFRLGVARVEGEVSFRGGLDLIAQGLDTSGYQDGFVFARIGIDSLDDLGFPTEGVRASLSHEEHTTSVGSESNFARVLADFSVAFSAGPNTLVLEGDAEVGDSNSTDLVDFPFIGGFLEISGLPPRSRFGLHRALVRAVAYRRLNQRGPLPVGVPVYAGMSLEKGNVWYEREDMSWGDAITAGSIFLGAKTPLGPAYFSFGITDEGDESVSIFLGQRFR